jgi:hypothetical protein
MKAPPNAGTVQPITADQLRKIIEGLQCSSQVRGRRRPAPRRWRCHVPSDDKLSVAAATLTGMRSCNLDPCQEWGNHRVEVRGRARIETVPPWLPLAFDATARAIGHPRKKKKGWRDFAPDIAALFRGMMEEANPGRPFRDRDGPLADFVATVIPLIFPNEKPSASAVGQYLARWRRKARA